MSSAVMAHLLQLDRPDATPRLPATAEAVTLTPSLSHGPQQDPATGRSRRQLAAPGDPLLVRSAYGTSGRSTKCDRIWGCAVGYDDRILEKHSSSAKPPGAASMPVVEG